MGDVQGVQNREQATLGAWRRKSKKAVKRALIFLFVLFTVLLELFIYFELINLLLNFVLAKCTPRQVKFQIKKSSRY